MSNVVQFENFNLVKQIGKGAFSNVYLCQNNSESLFGRMEYNEYFIIKEINIKTLVAKYVASNKNRGRDVEYVSQACQSMVNITPFQENMFEKTQEYEYYENRLTDLIKSEVEILKLIEHQNIIKFHDCTFNDDMFFIHMEYCNGGDVYEYLKRELRVSNDFVYGFANQVSLGLMYLHDKGIIHRDIKPHNILMTLPLSFKLSDFGFSCYDLSIKTPSDCDYQDTLCKKYFKLCGTPYYMAPELLLNMKRLENFTSYKKQKAGGSEARSAFYSSKVDCWSFGVCLYEILCNSLPFPSISDIRELESFFRRKDAQAYINGKVQRIKDTCLKMLIEKLLQIDQGHRYSMAQVQETLCHNHNHSPTRKQGSIYEMLKGSTTCEDPCLKKHIVGNPIKTEDIGSWVDVGATSGSSSVIMNVSVANGFMKWLMNNK
jgi:serine/threonine protein kinase